MINSLRTSTEMLLCTNISDIAKLRESKNEHYQAL